MLTRTSTLALAFVLAATSALRAQGASRVDLSGSWTGASGTAVFSSPARSAAGDSYGVALDAKGQHLEGTATFDGQRVTVTLAGIGGFLGALPTAGASTATSDQASYDYMRDGSTERLLAPGFELDRTVPPASTTALPWRSPNGASSGSWGGRAQIGATVAQLGALESGKTPVGNFVTRNPVVQKVMDWLQPGLSTSADQKKLAAFVASEESKWGQATTDLPRGSIKNQDLFVAQKAIALAKYGRTPADVTEGFVDAAGSVDGQAIAPRKIFWQEWKPIGKPSGRLVVISPGFQETGRSFYDQINLMNKEGDDVIVMDQQWAGYSQGSPGGLDRGFGVARDVAAVAAFAHEARPDEKLVLFGNSMGAGPGVLGAATLNDQGLVKLDGPPMPKGVPLVLQAPFIKMTPSLMNEAFAAMSHVPGVNQLELPSLGLPVLTHDATAGEAFANGASAGDVRAQAKTMTAANADLGTIMNLVDSGKGPTGRVYIVQDQHDPLADPSGSQELAKALGSRARLDLVQGNDHVLEQAPSEEGLFLPGLAWATAR
jgi:alpha-beta hydrolase superfamily lysophospholipase